MVTLDHVGFAVAGYQKSKAFYETTLAPLGLKLLMEFRDAAAGFGKREGERPLFFIEAHGSRCGGGFTSRYEPRVERKSTPSMLPPLRREAPTTAHPACGGTTPTTTAPTSSISTATTSRPSATGAASTVVCT